MKGMEEITAKQSQPKGRTRKKKIKIIEAAKDTNHHKQYKTTT
jgi:hypothetical protein